MNRLIFLLLVFCFLFSTPLLAQLPPACAGGQPATLCDQACIFCNFDNYVGSTQGYPSGPATNFCGTVENAQWIGFIAGLASATFTVQPTECSDGNGVQIALYEDCSKPPLACDKGKENGGTAPVSIKVALTPGRNYFLLIDGYAGDQCEFTVSVTPKEAVYEPPLGTVQAIQGKTEGCPGATFQYAVPPVFGAGAYIWDGPPGTLVDSLPVPATIVGDSGNVVMVTLGSESGNLCVQAANSCESNPPCASSLYITVLDDSHRPQLVTDSVAHLNCTGSPAEIPVDVLPLGDYTLRWMVDSLGHIVSGANSKTLRVDRTGYYTLTATNNVTGCSSSTTVRVGEPDIPSDVELFIRHITCFERKDGMLDIGAVTGGKGPHVYSLDDGPFVTTPQFRYLTAGDHHLRLQGIDGCELDTVFAMLQPADLVLTLAPDTTIQLGDKILLWHDTDLSEPARRKKTMVTAPLAPDMLCDTCMYQPRHSFRYEVAVLDSNGCRAADDRTVVVEPGRRVFIPNVFAPESDSENAVFRVICGTDVARVRTFRVYNRNGTPILEQNNLAPDDPHLGWDGRIGSEKALPAVFLYLAEIEFLDGETTRYMGDVTLMR